MTEFRQCKGDCRAWESVETDDVYGKVIDGKMVKMEGKRGNILIEAHGVINGERQDAYGNPEDNFQRIAEMWNDYLYDVLNVALQPRDVALMMALLKIARISTGTATRDSYIDAAGYIGLASDMSGKAQQ